MYSDRLYKALGSENVEINMLIIFILLLVGVCLFLLLNIYYLKVIDVKSNESLILKGLKGCWDYVAVGSTYGRYGIDFQNEGINGWNYCFAPQFLYYTDKILRQYSVTFKANCTVIIVLPDLVFGSAGKEDYDGANRYRRILNKESLGDDFSQLKYLSAHLPLLNKPSKIKSIIGYVIKRSKHDVYQIDKNLHKIEDWDKIAEKRCKEWCDRFGFKDTISGVLPPELKKEFNRSIVILQGMITYCIDNKFRPFLVVPPLSRMLNEKTSVSFFLNVLYDNIERANTFNIPVLDYREDKRLQDGNLYLNSDYLNRRGREQFTHILIEDIKKINSNKYD